MNANIKFNHDYYSLLYQNNWKQINLDFNIHLYKTNINNYSLINFINLYTEVPVYKDTYIYLKKSTDAYSLKISAFDDYFINASLLKDEYSVGLKAYILAAYEFGYDLSKNNLGDIKNHNKNSFLVDSGIQSQGIYVSRLNHDRYDFKIKYKVANGATLININHDDEAEKCDGKFKLLSYYYQIEKALPFWKEFLISYQYNQYSLKDLELDYHGDSPWPFGVFNYYGYTLDQGALYMNSIKLQKKDLFSWNISLTGSSLETKGLIKEYVKLLILPSLKSETSLNKRMELLTIQLEKIIVIKNDISVGIFIQQIIPILNKINDNHKEQIFSSNSDSNSKNLTIGGTTVKISAKMIF
tara:strand:- start:122 stop:1186 length:1065 start_codon:yes stop_codon:yes gene_type:complete